MSENCSLNGFGSVEVRENLCDICSLGLNLFTLGASGINKVGY